MATTNINIRVDELLKKDAEALFNDLGSACHLLSLCS